MPTSKDLATYRDVIQFADAAVKHDGAKIVFPAKGSAMNFRLRFNAMCKLWREENHGVSPYDRFMAVLEGRTVILRVRELGGVLTDLESNPIEAAGDGLGPVDRNLLEQVLKESE